MQTAENYSHLMAQTNNKLELSTTLPQLRNMCKQRELTIKQLSRQIQSKRNEMKDMSQQINAIIEKKLKKPAKQLPIYNTKHFSSKHKEMKSQIEKIYKHNEQLKHQISHIKGSQTDELLTDIKGSSARMADLLKTISNQERNNAVLSEELDRNKEIIQKYRNSSSLIEREQREVQFQNIIKECKHYEKQMTIMNAQELQTNIMLEEMQKYIDKSAGPIQEKIEPQIDQKELKALVAEINAIYDKRKIVEKESHQKIKHLQQTITKLEKQHKLQTATMREWQNDILRNTLQSKRYATYHPSPKKLKSQPKIDQIATNPEKTKNNKSKIVNKVYMVQKQEGSTIVVGDWNPQGQIFSDRGEHWQYTVERAKKVYFLTANQQLVGLRVVYLDKNSNQREGRTIIVPNVVSYSEVQLSLDEVHTFQHSSKAEGVFLRFIGEKETLKELGSKKTQINERISLEHYQIKWIQAQIGHKLNAIRFTLEDKPIEQKIIQEDQQQNKGITQRSFSNSTLAIRKALLKGRSLKKLREEPIVDHRLALGKSKGA